MCDFGRGKFPPLRCGCCIWRCELIYIRRQEDEFTRWHISPHSATLSGFFFWSGDILMSLLSFCPSDTLKQFLSIPSPPSSETLTLYNPNRRKTKMLCIRRGEGLLLWCFQTWIFPPPLNFAGILAAAAGSSEDTAALGKQPFFSCLLIEVALFQKPRGMKYHRGNHKTDLWWMLTRLHSHSVLRRLSPRAA